MSLIEERKRNRKAFELHVQKMKHSTKMYNVLADIFNLGSDLNNSMNTFFDSLEGGVEGEGNAEKMVVHWTDHVMPFLDKFYELMPQMSKLFDEDEQMEAALKGLQEESDLSTIQNSFGEDGIN